VTFETLKCVTVLSFFPAACYFAQAKAYKSAVLIVVTTLLITFPQKCSLYVPIQKVCALQTVMCTISTINWRWPNCIPLFIFPNSFLPIFYAVTLHLIGSYHDPITCKVAAENTRRMARYWPFWALTDLVRAQHGQASFSLFRTASQPFVAPILCMWLDTITILPHANDPTTCKVAVCALAHLKGHLFGYGGITVVKGTEFLRFDLMIRHI
jgi:hypothetical protein